MKFKFTVQQYQTDAVNAVMQVFNGQPKYEPLSYIRDLGKNYQQSLNENDDIGYKNAKMQSYSFPTISFWTISENCSHIQISKCPTNSLKIWERVPLTLKWKQAPEKLMFTSRPCLNSTKDTVGVNLL